MGAVNEQEGVQQEIRRLSLRIALARYDLWVAIMQGTPIGLCSKITEEIAICMLQRTALFNGDFHKLPYPIRHLYKPK